MDICGVALAIASAICSYSQASRQLAKPRLHQAGRPRRGCVSRHMKRVSTPTMSSRLVTEKPKLS